MLSFLRGHRPESWHVKRDAHHESQNTQNEPEAQEQEYLTVAAHHKNVRKTTYLLAVLFGIGMLCLWFMIKKSTPQTASATVVDTKEAQIEMAIARLTGVRSEMFRGLEKIVKKFYEFSDVKQVKVNELVKNPFKTERFLGSLKEIPDTKEGDFDIDADLMKQQAKDMQLLSIMQLDQASTERCCMIDDKILYEGDSIRGFKVRQISDSFVKLVWNPKLDEESEESLEGVEIILKLSE